MTIFNIGCWWQCSRCSSMQWVGFYKVLTCATKLLHILMNCAHSCTFAYKDGAYQKGIYGKVYFFLPFYTAYYSGFLYLHQTNSNFKFVGFLPFRCVDVIRNAHFQSNIEFQTDCDTSFLKKECRPCSTAVPGGRYSWITVLWQTRAVMQSEHLKEDSNDLQPNWPWCLAPVGHPKLFFHSCKGISVLMHWNCSLCFGWRTHLQLCFIY